MNKTQGIEKYRLIDHTADIGIEVFGENLSLLFSNAGYALFDIISDLSLVNSKILKKVTVTGKNLEELMVNWLGELVYVFDTENIIFKEFNILEINTSPFATTDNNYAVCESSINQSNINMNGKNVFLFSINEVKGHEEVKWMKLNAEIKGEKYDCKVHVINTAVKAVTYHQLKVIKDTLGWKSRVIFDV